MKLYTIRHKSTSKVIDVTPEKWDAIRSRSRDWEKIGEAEQEPKKKAVDKTVKDTAFGKMEIDPQLAKELREGDWTKAAE